MMKFFALREFGVLPKAILLCLIALMLCSLPAAADISIDYAKTLADGTPVSLDGKAVVYAPRDLLLSRSTSHFYVEETNRASAIKVVNSKTTADNAKIDNTISLSGVMRTVQSTGERYVELTSNPTVGTQCVVKPVAVNGRTIQSDAHIVGELVRAWGKVREIAPDKSYFTIDDGYAARTTVIVEDKTAVGAIAVDDFVVITGCVALDGDTPETASKVILLRTGPGAISLPKPLVSLSAASLASGTISSWTNNGTLGGSFVLEVGANPSVGAVTDTYGASAKAVTFDGTNNMILKNSSQAVIQSTSTILGNTNNKPAFSVSTWIYNPALEVKSFYFSFAPIAAGSTAADAIRGNGFQYSATLRLGDYYKYSAGANYLDVTSAQNPTAGLWHNITITCDGTASSTAQKLYVDGVFVKSLAGPGYFINSIIANGVTGYYPIRLGDISNELGAAKGQKFSGSIASLQLYDTALTEQAVQMLYNGPMTFGISGRVQNQSGAGISGATVFFSKTPGAAAAPLYSAITDTSGSYSQLLGNSKWYVAASANGYETSQEQTVFVDGASVSGVNFTLAAVPTYAISGKVVGQNGVGIAGATVYIKSSANASVSPTYTLTTDASGNYSQSVINGIWYITASATGYETANEKSVSVNGAAVPNTDFALNQIVTHTIAASAETGGSITPSGSVVVNHGASKTFTITAGTGYSISNVVVDGVGQGPLASYTFTNVTSDHTISVSFTSTGGSPLVAFYEFENNVNDTQGAFNGTAYGSPTFTAGRVGSYALTLNGSSQYVTIPRPISDDWTVSFFVRSSQTTKTGTAWYSGSGLVDGEVGGTANDFGIALLNNKVGFGVGNPDTTVQSTTSINTGSWMHVACTRNAANGEMKVYVNGVLEGTKTGPTGSRAAPATLHIGNLQTNTNYFKGTIDQLKIFRTVLSQTDINALLAEGGSTTWWYIQATGSLGGTISPDGNVAIADGENVTFTFTPDAHYSVKDVVVDGVSLGSIGSYTFSNVKANHTISVEFAQETLPGVITGPYLQGLSQNSVYVLVETDNTNPVTVEYGERAEDCQVKATTTSIEPTGSDPMTYVHNVKLTGLQANRTYNYCVNVNGTRGIYHEFKTLVDPGTSFRFAMYGDFKGATAVPDTINARVDAAKPLFRLYAGDLANTSAADTFRREFLRPAEIALTAKVPFFNSPGNHETWSPATKAFTHGPDSASGTQDYYSFDCGDVHFVQMNDQISYGPGSAQYNWMAADLAASNKPWKVVWSHYPAYTSTSDGHGEDPTTINVCKNLWVPNKVDMVFYCHNHFYQHNLVDGIHHMVVGTAGSPFYTPTDASYTIKSVKTYCYAIVDVTPTTYTMTAYDDSGNVLETISLSKQFAISGKVQSSGGTGIYNAVVSAGGASSRVNPVVTDASGNYTLNLPGPGTYDIYADAPGYSASFATVTVTASGTVTNNITLTPAAETTLYNGNFEIVGTGSMPDGWESFIVKPNNSVDYYGNAWPDKPDMYVFGRSTSSNATPGGIASGQISTGSPLSSYGVLRMDRLGVSGDPCTGLTESTVVVSGRTWANNYYADGATYVQLAHGGNDGGLVYPLTGDFKVVSNTADTLTVAPGSNLVSSGYTAGDKFRFLREVRSYWYTAGIRTSPARRMPVDRNYVYNFYFRQKTAYTGKETEKCHVFSLIWRDAAGNELDRLAYTWNWQPGTGFTPCVPKLFLAPPANAATVEACIYTTCVDTANPAWSDSSLIDDVVIDPVPVAATNAIKALADNTRVVVPGNCVSLSPRDTSGERSTNYYYVSEPNGSAGLRIQNRDLKLDKLFVNDTISVSGLVKTDANTGEKYVLAGVTGTAVTTGGAAPNTATVASVLSGANVLGNFVAINAQVSSIAADVSSFNITDDTGTIRVKSVNFPMLANFAKVGDPIRINGVVSKDGTERVILLTNYSRQTTAFPDNDVTFFAISDVHYGGGWATRLLHKQRIEAMNAMNGTPYPSNIGGAVGECRGVTITGDITDNDNDKAGQFAEFVMDFGIDGRNHLRYPVYEGLGNHDGGVTYPAADGIKPRNPYRPAVTNISPDGLNYSWDWGKVHFVHTNEVATYLNQDSLLWLQNDLAANVGNSGRPVVLFQHEGFDSFSFAFYSRGESTRLYNIIKNYNVIALLWGHTGGFAQYKWGNIDVFGTDGAMTLFHVFHITQNELIVTRRDWANNSWMNWSFRKTITGNVTE